MFICIALCCCITRSTKEAFCADRYKEKEKMGSKEKSREQSIVTNETVIVHQREK